MFLQEIQCFIAVAECLNFTQAANQLYLSQPGLSKIIANLERELNVRLFIRSTRSVRMTKAGEKLLAVSREFLHQCGTLNIAYPQDSISLSGNLTIGIGDLNENRYLPQIIAEFSTRCPLCNLSVQRYTPEELLGALDTGEVDFGVMVSLAIPKKGYQYLVYYPSKLMLVVPSYHRLANQERVDITELKDENFVTLSRSINRAIDHIQEICAKGNFRPKFVKETNSLNTMFMLIATGMGVSLHFLLHKDSCNYDLRFIGLETGETKEEKLTDGAALVWKEQNQNPALKPFIDCIHDCMERFLPEQMGLL